MFWTQKNWQKQKVAILKKWQKTTKWAKPIAKNKKMAILKKWQKTQKWQFWATSFDLLTFKHYSTDSFDMISRKDFKGLVT